MSTVASISNMNLFPPREANTTQRGQNKAASNNTSDFFSISDEAYENYSAEQLAKVSQQPERDIAKFGIDERISAVSSQGNKVTLEDITMDGSYKLSLTLLNGQNISLSANGNMRITNTEDGGVIITTEGGSRRYDSTGKEISTAADNMPLTGTDGDDIIINMFGTKVDGGTGNDTIINLQSGAVIHGGDGDDQVIWGANFGDGSVDLGSGNDKMTVSTQIDGTLMIDGGDGDDTINMGNSFGTITVNGGKGDDTINMGNTFGRTTVDGGEGNDSINIENIYGDGSTIIGGMGDDSISIGRFRKSTLKGDSGEDTINVGTAINSIIDGGDGKNVITVDTLHNSLLLGGSGTNEIQVKFMLNSWILSDGVLSAQQNTPQDSATENNIDEAAMKRTTFEENTYETASSAVVTQNIFEKSWLQSTSHNTFDAMLSQSISLHAH